MRRFQSRRQAEGGCGVVARRITKAEFDDTMAQVKRWGLDEFLKERDFGKLTAETA
jgi:hypothetical protein